MVYFPFLHLLIKENFVETVSLWNTKVIEIGLANNLLRLLYGFVVLPRDKTYDVLFVNSWCVVENLAYLLVICAPHKRELKKVSSKSSFFCLFRIGIVF